MNVLYVSKTCPGCQQVLNTVCRVNKRILAETVVRWIDRDQMANEELRALGGTAVPAFVTDAGTAGARLFVGSGQIHQLFANRYPMAR